jgi:putative FmdB family regulatory protein
MPTYEYECKNCGHTFEAIQSMRDDPLKVCPECGKEVRRLINGGSGIIFRGSGFYVTDKKGGSASAETKSGESKTPPESGSSGSSEKPAAKKTETASSPGAASGTTTTKT